MTHCYFENIEKQISAHIASAEKRIFVVVAWFTNHVLFDSLVHALERNIEVKLIVLDDILNRSEFGLDFGKLANCGADICFASINNGVMHNKFCIIDDRVITGSYNWTYQANKNRENIIITDEPTIVDSYVEQFEKLFNEGTSISVPYEQLKWTDIKEGDFTELRRNIYRDVVAKNDESKELKQAKLISLDKAYKSGNTEKLA